MTASHDLIIVGLGGIGSAVCCWAARSGLRVLGLEQFELGHDRGGSQDHSRVLRLAHSQAPYAALARPAYEAWRAVEEDSGQQLVTITGGLMIDGDEQERIDGSAPAMTVDSIADQMTDHGFPFELLRVDEVAEYWPQWRLDGGERALYSPDTAIVDAGRANAVHAALARARGANILTGQRVISIGRDGVGVKVRTADDSFRANALVVTVGAWTQHLLATAGVNLPLRVTQEQVSYYAPTELATFEVGRFPIFQWHGRRSFYGFPVHGPGATKLGEHLAGPNVEPDDRTFDPDPVRQQRYRAFCARRLPGFAGPETLTKTCLYTVPADHHFVLDTLPTLPHTAVAVGAGHAFKFAGLMGRILTELATEGRSEEPIDTFRLDRPGLKEPVADVAT